MYSAYTTEKSADIPEANTVLEEFETKFYFKISDDIIEVYDNSGKKISAIHNPKQKAGNSDILTH